MRRAWPVLAVLLLAACSKEGRRPPESLFVGIDVSGSFEQTGRRESALEFLSYYLHARLNERGGLAPLKALYVGSIGGEMTEESKSFYPIHAFQGKAPARIHEDLKAWFPRSDKITDFNIFFNQVAAIAQKRNLALSPITVLLISDGVPDLSGRLEGPAHQARFDLVDAGPLEFLSRRVTLRLLFPSPMVASRWETKVKRRRARLWTVDGQVMEGWKMELDAARPPEQQERLWKWIADNVDYRVRSSRIGLKSKARVEEDEMPEPPPPATPAPKPKAVKKK